MADKTCYIEFVGGSLVVVMDWLVSSDCPYEYRVSDFPLEAINKLQGVIDNQIAEIEGISARVETLEAELEDAIEEAEEAEDRAVEAEEEAEEWSDEVEEMLLPSSRRPPPHFKLPDERPAITHKFQIGGSPLGEGYLITGLYPNSKEVGEIFIKMSVAPKDVCLAGEDTLSANARRALGELKEQVSDLTYFLRGILDQLAIAVSIGLQRGIPLKAYAEKFAYTRFPPAGWTRNEQIRNCTSILDYIFRWLAARYAGEEMPTPEIDG